MSFLRDLIKGDKHSAPKHQEPSNNQTAQGEVTVTNTVVNPHAVQAVLASTAIPEIPVTSSSAAVTSPSRDASAGDNDGSTLPPQRSATAVPLQTAGDTSTIDPTQTGSPVTLSVGSSLESQNVETVSTVASSISSITTAPVEKLDWETESSSEASAGSTQSSYKKKVITKHEAAEIYMYGPSDDIWNVPTQDQRIPIDVEVVYRTNKAQALRKSHIEKRTQERIEYEKRQAIKYALAQKLASQTVRLAEEERRQGISVPMATAAPIDHMYSTMAAQQKLQLAAHTSEDGPSEMGDSYGEGIMGLVAEDESSEIKGYSRIHRPAYRPPRITVHETVSSKFRFLLNRKPENLILRFRSTKSKEHPKKRPMFTLPSTTATCYS